MNPIGAAEEQLVSERMKRKLNEVNEAAKSQLSSIQDHVNFTLQRAYFKCAYDCFDPNRKQDEITNCVEHCSAPVMNAQNFVDSELAKFQEKMQRSLMVCQDRYETLKQQGQYDAINSLESCVNQSIEDSIKTLPHVAARMKASLGISN